MFWRELRSVNTLIRTSAAGAQRSLGPESEQSQAIYASFMKRKEQAEQRKKSLALKLDEMRKLNKVYGVGRTPQVVVSLLQLVQLFPRHLRVIELVTEINGRFLVTSNTHSAASIVAADN